MPDRRTLAVLGLLVIGACTPAGDPPTDLNVLLIVVDDLRPDLGSYGHPVVQSPNIDRLAQRGLRFDRAYSQFPVCNPSRASLLTGLRPTTTGVLDNETHFRDLLPDVVTLPQLFRQNGYYTASVGKIFHGAGPRKGKMNPESWDEAQFPRGRRRARQADERQRFRFDSGESIGWIAAGGEDGDQTDGQVAQETVALLERVRERPFFVAAGFIRPHTPLIAPERYFELYSAEALAPYLAGDGPAEGPEVPGRAHHGEIAEHDQLELLRAYYACVSFVDAQIGRVLDVLDRYELWETTVVVLVSDHGVHLGERSWWSKNTLTEVASRVPMVVHVPGSAHPGEATEAVVELIDLYPTLVELAGLDGAPPLDGRSLVPLLERPDHPWEGEAHTLAARDRSVGASIRTDRWRYSEWRGESELFDHRNDPDELENLAYLPEHAATVAELSARLIRPPD